MCIVNPRKLYIKNKGDRYTNYSDLINSHCMPVSKHQNYYVPIIKFFKKIKNKGEIETFQTSKKLRKIVAGTQTLWKILKEVLQTESK